MTTWIDMPHDYAESAARDAEIRLCAPIMCPVCGGSGERKWNPSRTRDPQCVETAVCRRCDGEGFLDPERERDAYVDWHIKADLEDQSIRRRGIEGVL